jgi:hypothetical protein
LNDILDVLGLLSIWSLQLRFLLDDFGLLYLARCVPPSARACSTTRRAVWFEEQLVAGLILSTATSVFSVKSTLSLVYYLSFALSRNYSFVIFIARALFDFHRFIEEEAVVIAVYVVQFGARSRSLEARGGVDDFLIMAKVHRLPLTLLCLFLFFFESHVSGRIKHRQPIAIVVFEVHSLRFLFGPMLLYAGIGLHLLTLSLTLILGLEANQGVDVVVGINVIELKRSRLLDVFTLSQIRIAGTVASVEIRLHVVRRDLRVFEQFLIPLLNS